ncbi:hypothetical protein Tco_1371029 [Tanacetum coccineum]
MVGTRGSTPKFSGPAFDAAVQRAVDALLPGLTTRLTNEIRQNGARGSGDQPPTIHTWLERFGKQKPRSFSSATTPVDAENWIAHIENLPPIECISFQLVTCQPSLEFISISQNLEYLLSVSNPLFIINWSGCRAKRSRLLFPKPFQPGVDGGRLVTTSPSAIQTDLIGKQTAHSFALFEVVTVAILRFQYDALLMLMVDWLTLSNRVVQDALDKANLAEVDLSAIVVTIAPGLSLCVRDRDRFEVEQLEKDLICVFF